ncbi:MAG: histidinol-phosphate transaminase [Myxococcales bacterium]|nr:histidinol-phosphate transaminase [Myxococcales bacterium]
MSDGGGWRDRVRAALRPLDPYHVPPLPAAVKLDANESPYSPPAAFLDALAEEVRGVALHRYPDPRASRLRAAIAADLGQPEERLVLGNGSDELIGLLASTFAEPRLGEREARMVYPGPSFVVYRTAAAAAGMEVCEAPLGPRFEADYDALAETLARARPSLVFVATPNNPTGTEWPRAAIERLVLEHPDVVIIVDEAYAAYSRTSFLDLVDRAENCAVMRTYSKIGLAGLRVGVLVAQPALAREVEKVRPPYNLGTLPQLAAELAIRRFSGELTRHVDEVVAERERLCAAFATLPGVEWFPTSANLVLIRVAEAHRVFAGLASRGVLVRNLSRPGPLAGCLRVTVGTPDENDRFLTALRAVLAS